MKNYKQKYQPEAAKKLLAKIGYNENPEKISEEELQRTMEIVLSSSELNQRDIEILDQRYGLNDNVPHSLRETGMQLELTGERIRQLEIKAIKKIVYPEGISEQRRTRIRLRKLIPSLEYDVLYEPLFLARDLRVSLKFIKRSVNELSEEFDLAQIKPTLKSNRFLIIRIGEQSQDLPVPSEPFEVPEKDLKLKYYSQRDYEIAYKQFWKEMESEIFNKGYISSSIVNEFFYQGRIRKRAFRDFMRDSMLPVAIYQDYRIGFRKPMIVYHPTILRQVRDRKSGID